MEVEIDREIILTPIELSDERAWHKVQVDWWVDRRAYNQHLLTRFDHLNLVYPEELAFKTRLLDTMLAISITRAELIGMEEYNATALDELRENIAWIRGEKKVGEEAA